MTHGWAVAAAALGAVLFGLAAVRQHGAVQTTMGGPTQGLRDSLSAFLQLVRQPAWLLGSLQGVVAGGLHVVALALAPITLIQPIGVLAVPVTVVATALRERRRPSRSQGIGSVLSVAGVGALTLLLISPTTNPVSVPGWQTLALTTAAAAAVTLVVMAVRLRSPLARCVTLAAAASALFGLNSILIRTIGHVLVTGSREADRWVLTTAVVGIAVALALGLWAMQTAYLSGSPHVVICCLTLLDPLVAVAGGNLLLGDGVALPGLTLIAAVGCAVVAAIGVVFLSVDPVAVGAGESRGDLAQARLSRRRRR